jgi:hypothetical protein
MVQQEAWVWDQVWHGRVDHVLNSTALRPYLDCTDYPALFGNKAVTSLLGHSRLLDDVNTPGLHLCSKAN